jgi:tetratricopeptide (TPR) repeat protein
MSGARPTRSRSRSPAPAVPEADGVGAADGRSPRIAGRRTALFVAALAAASAAAWYLAPRADPAQVVDQAEASIQAQQWEAAKACVRRLERIRTPTPADRVLRARVAVGFGDDDAALEELRRIADDPELSPRALYMTGLIERRRNRLRYAEAAYRKAVERDPAVLQARRELIFILGMQSRRRELDGAFKAMAGITTLSHYDLYIWCLTHFVSWGPDSAEELQPFLTADPDDRQTRLAMARLLLGKPGQEQRIEETLAPLPQDDAEVQAIRIEGELNRGRVEEATRLIATTRADDPRLARLRGRIAMRRGDRDTAVREFRRALSDEPYDRVSNSELGKALLLQGHRDEAERHLARSRHLDELYNLVTRIGKPGQGPPPVEDFHRLAQVCESAGLPDEARGWYTLAISQDPLDPIAQQGLHRLGPTPTTASGPR